MRSLLIGKSEVVDKELLQKLTDQMIIDLVEINRLKKLVSTSDIAKVKVIKLMIKYVYLYMIKKLKVMLYIVLNNYRSNKKRA